MLKVVREGLLGESGGKRDGRIGVVKKQKSNLTWERALTKQTGQYQVRPGTSGSMKEIRNLSG